MIIKQKPESVYMLYNFYWNKTELAIQQLLRLLKTMLHERAKRYNPHFLSERFSFRFVRIRNFKSTIQLKLRFSNNLHIVRYTSKALHP